MRMDRSLKCTHEDLDEVAGERVAESPTVSFSSGGRAADPFQAGFPLLLLITDCVRNRRRSPTASAAADDECRRLKSDEKLQLLLLIADGRSRSCSPA